VLDARAPVRLPEGDPKNAPSLSRGGVFRPLCLRLLHHIGALVSIGSRVTGQTGRRVRAGNAAENFAVIRHLVVNLLKNVQGGLTTNEKLGVYNKRLLAAWDQSYLLRILGIASA
jgi:hypothetical protein